MKLLKFEKINNLLTSVLVEIDCERCMKKDTCKEKNCKWIASDSFINDLSREIVERICDE